MDPTIALENRLMLTLRETEYKPDTGFQIVVKGRCVFVKHWQVLPDCHTGELTVQEGRKFYVSEHMTDEEILRTMLLAIHVFEEHEANECFRYRGERVLNPHPEGPRPDWR